MPRPVRASRVRDDPARCFARWPQRRGACVCWTPFTGWFFLVARARRLTIGGVAGRERERYLASDDQGKFTYWSRVS